MNKLIYKTIILVVLLIVIDLIFGFSMQAVMSYLKDGRYYKAKYALEETNEDIIIHGSSLGETNYVSQIIEDSLGMTCYNTSRGNQGFAFHECISRAILKRYTPKYVIINVHHTQLQLELTPDIAGEILKPFYSSCEAIQPILNKAANHAFITNRINLVAYNSSYFYLLRPFLKKGLDGKLEDKGWKPRHSTMAPNDKIDTITYNGDLVPESVEAFDRIMHSYMDAGAKLIFVTSPFYHNYQAETKTRIYAREFARKHNIPFIHLTNEPMFTENNKYFNDRTHLNKTGAEVFTKELIKRLKCIMPSK